METWQLKQKQSLPLEVKIEMSKRRIVEWYEHYEGNVYVSFSGGKDSTVLLDLVRQIYPDVPAVFVDTGLEYPEVKDFVKTIKNVIWLRPKMKFKDVIDKYGYPVISKEQAQYIQQYRNAKSQKTKDIRMYGDKNGGFKISEKWKFLLNSPFKISERCCDVMKKAPIKIYQKETNNKAIIGTMADESSRRKTNYLKFGCNAFEKKDPSSTPLAFWVESDILQYIKEKNISYASVYGDIILIDGKYKTTKCDRTGCMFCMFGVHLESTPNRFQRMAITHPKQYKYCIENLGIGDVLAYIKVPYNPQEDTENK